MQNGAYGSYKKSKFICIHSLSNHRPNVIKHIATSIQERLSKNSPNEDISKTRKCACKDVLNISVFKVDFKCTKTQREKLKNISQITIWFNPPFNKAVSKLFQKLFLD